MHAEEGRDWRIRQEVRMAYSQPCHLLLLNMEPELLHVCLRD